MSRKSEGRKKKKVEALAQEAEWDSGPKLPELRSTEPKGSLRTRHVELLRVDPAEWFPADQVQAAERVRKALDSPSEVKQLARELELEGYQNRESSPRHSNEHMLVLSYWRDLMCIVWPQELDDALAVDDGERTGDHAEALIRFLEVCPFSFRTGYVKQIAIRILRQCPLSDEHRLRISGILRDRVKLGRSRQMRGWPNLVPLSDPEESAEIVRQGLASGDRVSIERAVTIGMRLLGYTHEATPRKDLKTVQRAFLGKGEAGGST